MIKYFKNKPKKPIIISVPHSGSYYPDIFLKQKKINLSELRIMEDFQCKKIIEKIDKSSANIIIADCSRAVVDLNRSRISLDEKMFEKKINCTIESLSDHEIILLNSGLGVIPKKCYQKNIYKKLLTINYAETLLKKYYDPYHNFLMKNIKLLHNSFGKVILLDIHSMPTIRRNKFNKSADIVLGDNFGLSCKSLIKDFILKFFQNSGLNVKINEPYSGGYITRFYGNKSKNINVIQIEISKNLYMDERNYKLKNNVKELQKLFQNLIHNMNLTEKMAAE